MAHDLHLDDTIGTLPGRIVSLYSFLEFEDVRYDRLYIYLLIWYHFDCIGETISPIISSDNLSKSLPQTFGLYIFWRQSVRVHWIQRSIARHWLCCGSVQPSQLCRLLWSHRWPHWSSSRLPCTRVSRLMSHQTIGQSWKLSTLCLRLFWWLKFLRFPTLLPLLVDFHWCLKWILIIKSSGFLYKYEFY